MRVLDDVVRRLGPARVAGQTPLGAQAGEVVPPGEQLVHVGLATGVEHHGVARRVEHAVDGQRQLDGSEVRPEVPSVAGHRIDDELADLDRERRQLLVAEVAQVGGLADTGIDANEAALERGSATGIQFAPVDQPSLMRAIERSVRLYGDRKAWSGIQKAGMKSDVSWEKSAARYAMLYKTLRHRN